jgi:hypothetical protein
MIFITIDLTSLQHQHQCDEAKIISITFWAPSPIDMHQVILKDHPGKSHFHNWRYADALRRCIQTILLRNLFTFGHGLWLNKDPVSESKRTLPYGIVSLMFLSSCLCLLICSRMYCTSFATASRISFLLVLHGAARVIPLASL